jgi:hypothetical protein
MQQQGGCHPADCRAYQKADFFRSLSHQGMNIYTDTININMNLFISRTQWRLFQPNLSCPLA